ncbi:MAG TPA: flagellar export chaperone FliS [Chloroflexota bacterium]
MSVQAYQQYQRTQTETASPGELVVMMYKGAIKFLGSARQNLELRDLEATNRHVLRAQEIILELMISVDVNVGPVARNLFDLYEFMHRHLVQANIRKDGQMMAEVEQLLRELVPAWEQAVQAGRKVTPLPTTATYAAPAGQLRFATA